MKLSLPAWLGLAAALFTQSGCRPESDPAAPRPAAAAPEERAGGGLRLDPCVLALAPHSGTNRLDLEIIRLQQEAAKSPQPQLLIERLGWLYVRQARVSFDPGFYKLAEQCALCLDAKQPGSLEARLLRGHALQNMHRFKEAEPLARALVAQRGAPFDHGLLGDVLLEIGQLDAAIGSYQKMMELKPDLHAYARAAQVRWLKGDADGASEAMQLAADAASPQDAESAAWACSRLAFYQWHAGRPAEARKAIATARQWQADYPPALLLLGRLLLGEDQSAAAVEPLQRAAQLNPLPEYQWALAEALRAAGRAGEARPVEDELNRTGASHDPRTYALYLATRREQPDLALQLAQAELQTRGDLFTHDALAWAFAATGRWHEARTHSRRALAEGTADARLFLHAGVIAAHSGQLDEARDWFEKARARGQLLLPSERAELRRAASDPVSKN